MLQLPAYEFQSSENETFFRFESTGPKGVIQKVASLTHIAYNFYNLGFGDFDPAKGTIHDKVVSKNEDTQTVMNTIANILLHFFHFYSGAMVFAEGSTPARTRLYQQNIGREIEHISLSFMVMGFTGQSWESFKKEKITGCFWSQNQKISTQLSSFV